LFLSFRVYHAKKNMITDPASLSHCCGLAQSHVGLEGFQDRLASNETRMIAAP
jgi:hypothetical protein